MRNDNNRCLGWFEVGGTPSGMHDLPGAVQRLLHCNNLRRNREIERGRVNSRRFCPPAEQPSEVGSETALEYAWRAIWGKLFADDACIVPRSPRGLVRRVAVFFNVFGAFGLAILESKTETMCTLIPRSLATQTGFNATGQQYR